MSRPWNVIPIHDNDDPLIELPLALHRLLPHPYMELGAPYGASGSPFQLRRAVVERLLIAEAELQRHEPTWRLAIFDAWRPVAVQAFMVEHALLSTYAARGVDAAVASPEREAIRLEVGRFWAPPSQDPSMPPPHSTGAAVDLTLAEASGEPLAMGGEIDAIDPVSEPDHYADFDLESDGHPARWHHRRLRLRSAMTAAGFCQHPNEWWHFSHGDQLWAWQSAQASAVYGRWLPVPGGA
ncbi:MULTISPECIES: M15 family metallopeptidase [Synechococcales]|uniref:M15 family metallopeptidase n=1 Tax=Synechococcus sp. CS-1325 TaxID=2847979 RepID=UPI00223AC748|nr:M15 family metallopeptidase [Synechococcus sp. CS-1325]